MEPSTEVLIIRSIRPNMMILSDGICTSTILGKQLHMNFHGYCNKTVTCEPSRFFTHGKVFSNILISCRHSIKCAL